MSIGHRRGAKAAWRHNGLTIVFGVLLLVFVVGQAVSGLAEYNETARTIGLQQISMIRYVSSSSFAVDLLENWQSEYLQFSLFIFGTVWLLQRGSPESKELDKAGRESDEDQKLRAHADPESPKWAKVGGLRTWLFSNSLLLVMGTIWLASWFGQSVTGRVAYNAERFDHQQGAVSWWQYLGSPDFWNRTLQNWQSEFLAVGSMAVLSIYLRQRGSPESKPVGAPHSATGVEG
jgi:uncharacterized protein DUF6766